MLGNGAHLCALILRSVEDSITRPTVRKKGWEEGTLLMCYLAPTERREGCPSAQ